MAPSPRESLQARASPLALQDPLSTIARMAVMPALLKALCKLTGMGVAAVARLTERSWTARAVHGDIDIGIKVSQQLDRRTMLGYGSYVSVPIVAADGDVFRSLCVLDARAVTGSHFHSKVVVNAYAELISQHLKSDDTRRRSTEQRRVSAARSANHYVGVLADSLRMVLKAIGSHGDHLKHRSWDPALLEFSNRIDDNVCRISALLDSALDSARGQHDGGIYRHGTAHLLAESTRAWGQHRRIVIEAQGTTFSVRIPRTPDRRHSAIA